MYDPAPGLPNIEPIVFVEGNKLDVVHSFLYLGSTLTEGCSLDREISFRIERASLSFSALNKRVWSQHGFRYISIWESRATKHPVDGNEKLSPMGLSLVRMDDSRLPMQLFYGEMWEGKKSALKPKKRFKDIIKYYLKKSGQPVNQWEKMVSDRSKWRKLIHESIESFKNSRMQYSAHKRLVPKGEEGPAPRPQSHHANCDIRGKLCLSLADLKSNLPKCAKSILHPNNVTASKTERLC